MSASSHYFCVIMAGGVGSRFWPISRDSRPKQFLSLPMFGKSFLQMAYRRALEVVPPENILVVTQTRYRSLVLEQLPEIPEDNVLPEPFNRNTASCIVYANCVILKRDRDAVVLVAPADQVIDDNALFRSTVLAGLDYAASSDALLTLGVLPRRADPNFGYIQTDGPMEDGSPVRVKTFTEKPGRELAQVFVDSGEFLWNAGIFIWRATVIAEEIRRYAPEVAAQWNGWEQFIRTPYEREYLERIYPDMPRTSIDYAVMEKSERVMTIPAAFDWNDLGNWKSLYEYFAGQDGNALLIGGRSVVQDGDGILAYAPRKDKLVAIRGLKDFIVIDNDDVLMICPRDEQALADFIYELSGPDFGQFR